MAIIKACNISNSVRNTGKECDTAMVATAMLIAIQQNVKFTDTDMLDPVAWLRGLIHQRKAFPLFGNAAPIRTINNNAESDVTVTLDDGTVVFLRYGVYNRTFETTNGGLCFAKSLQSFNSSGYSMLEIDISGQMQARKNSDGTYSGFRTSFMFSPAPILADLKSTPYKNRFQVSYTPSEVVSNGIIFTGADALLSETGLLDVTIKSAAAATVTKLKISVATECAGTDLIALIGSQLANVSNFVVTNKATGAVVPITSVAIVAGVIELTGSFTSGVTYHVVGSIPTVWKTNLVEGYDASPTGEAGVDILVP